MESWLGRWEFVGLDECGLEILQIFLIFHLILCIGEAQFLSNTGRQSNSLAFFDPIDDAIGWESFFLFQVISMFQSDPEKNIQDVKLQSWYNWSKLAVWGFHFFDSFIHLIFLLVVQKLIIFFF